MLFLFKLVSPFHVLVAVNKAIANEERGQLITRNVFSEILFNLSISNSVCVWKLAVLNIFFNIFQISDSFKQFGMKDGSENILAIMLSPTPDNDVQVIKFMLNRYITS